MVQCTIRHDYQLETKDYTRVYNSVQSVYRTTVHNSQGVDFILQEDY